MKQGSKIPLQTILITIIVIVTLVYAIFIRPNYYRFNGGKIYFEPVFSQRYANEEDYQVYAYDGYIYLGSQNGVKKVSKEGESIWDKSFYMENPTLLTDASYLAMVDIMGKTVYVFNQDGIQAEITVEYPILFADINKQGALVLVEEREGNHLIQLYNREGTLIADRNTIYSKYGYPIAVALSDSGERMTTSFLTFKDGSLTSDITFYDFGDSQQKDSDKIIGGFAYQDIMIPQVQFIDESHLVAIGDHELIFYVIGDTPKIENTVTLSNKIEQMAINDENVILYLGESTEVTNQDLKGQVVVYSREGNCINQYDEPLVKAIYPEGDHYYLVTTDSIDYYSAKKRLWSNTSQRDITEIMKLGKDQYLIVLKHGYEIVKLQDI